MKEYRYRKNVEQYILDLKDKRIVDLERIKNLESAMQGVLDISDLWLPDESYKQESHGEAQALASMYHNIKQLLSEGKMILSFKKQFPWKGTDGKPAETNFKQKILDGIKIHTFREDPNQRWHAGRKIHMAAGVRTKNYFCFLESECVSVQSIHIQYEWFHQVMMDLKVIVDGDLKYHIQDNGIHTDGTVFIEQLAKNDGFDSVEDFFKWFHSDYQGKIIHWTDFRY